MRAQCGAALLKLRREGLEIAHHHEVATWIRSKFAPRVRRHRDEITGRSLERDDARRGVDRFDGSGDLRDALGNTLPGAVATIVAPPSAGLAVRATPLAPTRCRKNQCASVASHLDLHVSG